MNLYPCKTGFAFIYRCLKSLMKITNCAYVQYARIRLISILMLCLLGGSAFADRVQALQAETRGNYSQAVKLWLQLANNGDPVAQYNLALIYQRGSGVNVDDNLYKYWLTMAARSGFADAYTMLNSQALHPTNRRVHVTLHQDPEEWLASQNPGYYTLQLASSTNKSQIQKYYKENELAGKGGYYHTRRSGQDWYSLVYGAYPSIGDAKLAMTQLPDALKIWSPWVRNIKSIQRIMVR